MRWMARLAAVMLVLAAGLGNAQAPIPKLALVIGNAAYTIPAWRLPNPGNDAAEIASRLRRMGFDVEIAKDASKAQMTAAFARFDTRLRNAGPQAVSFFYYAGHAAQRDDVNYLVPIDADAPTLEDLQAQAPPLQSIFESIAAAGNNVNIIVLDACRNMPLPAGGGQLAAGGLAEAGRRGAMFIAYATSPGATAADGGGVNSPFTSALVNALDKQQTDPIALLFEDVQYRVYLATDQKQRPEYRNGLVGAPRWSFAAAATPPPPPPSGLSSFTPSRELTAQTPFLQSLDRARLLQLAPRNVFFVDTLLARRDLLAKAGVDTPLRLAHLLAQIGYETVDFRPVMEENLSLSAERLLRIFPRHFPDLATAQAYEKQPERIANRVYARAALGNGDEASGDGWRYRGRGYFQITGRANYRQLGRRIGVDLEGSPDLMSDPEVSLAAVLATWNALGLSAYADADNFAAVSRGVNRGNPRSPSPAYGEIERGRLTERAKIAVGLATTP